MCLKHFQNVKISVLNFRHQIHLFLSSAIKAPDIKGWHDDIRQSGLPKATYDKKGCQMLHKTKWLWHYKRHKKVTYAYLQLVCNTVKEHCTLESTGNVTDPTYICKL